MAVLWQVGGSAKGRRREGELQRFVICEAAGWQQLLQEVGVQCQIASSNQAMP
jgi:hypothetical protein